MISKSTEWEMGLRPTCSGIESQKQTILSFLSMPIDTTLTNLLRDNCQAGESPIFAG